MHSLITEKSGFSIGSPIPLPGLEGETIVVFRNQIAALSSAKAIWKYNEKQGEMDLPYVPVNHARWSGDGTKVFIGVGTLDVLRETWEPHPVLANVVPHRAPGAGGFGIKSTSWSGDGRYVAVFISWSGLRDQVKETVKILVFNLETGAPAVELPADNAEDVLIIDRFVVVLSPEITIWTFEGELAEKLSPTPNTPFRFSVDANEEHLMLIDNDGSVRIVDVKTWDVKAQWKGSFRDILRTDQGFIALDLDGQLHAACLSGKELRPIGIARTGLLASRLALADEGRLIIMGNGPTAIHAIPFKLNCENPN